MIGGVGACKMEDCMFNQSLECAVKAISVKAHAHHADCATYKTS